MWFTLRAEFSLFVPIFGNSDSTIKKGIGLINSFDNGDLKLDRRNVASCRILRDTYLQEMP